MIVEIVKAVFVPGSLSFLVVVCVASLVMIVAGGGSRRIGQTSFALLALTYFVVSLPWVAERLAATLATRPSCGAPRHVNGHAASGPGAIVIFSGDYPAGRIDEAVRLYRKTDPRWVIVSGWPALSQSLVARGIARERLVWDPVPRTTREQATRLVPLLRARDIDHFVLIASSIHMRRALGASHAIGLDPVPVQSAVAMPWVSSGRTRFLPHRAALRLTREAMYEHLALALYANRGWLASDPTPAAGEAPPPLVPRVATPPPLAPPGGAVVHVSSEPMLQTAVRQLASDTTIMLAPGTYRLTSTLWINGRFRNIAIRGATENRDDVVLAGPGMTAPAASVPHGIWTGGGVRGITIANVTIRDVAEHAIVFNAGTQEPRVYNVRLADAGQQFIKANPGPGPGDSNAAGGVNDGRVEYSLIEYTSSAKDGYTNGIDVHAGAGWTIRHNVFRNIVSPAGQLPGPAVLMWNGSRDTLTEGNTFLNCARGISYGLEEKSGGLVDHRGGIIRNNFFFRSADQPGDVGIMVADSPATQVLDNSVFVSGTHPTSIEYRFRATRDVVIANNRLDAMILARDGASGIERQNVMSRYCR